MNDEAQRPCNEALLLNVKKRGEDKCFIFEEPGAEREDCQVANARTLFLLEPQRHLSVSGTQNFRDLGGYLTSGGKKVVRWNRLYRSDNISQIPRTFEMFDFLNERLRIRCIIDLRSNWERDKNPYNFAVIPTRKIPICVGDEVFRAVYECPALSEDVAEACMLRLFELLVTDFTSEVSQFLRILIEQGERYPKDAVLFHCKAGKDRTGYCAAVLLLILDIPLETVFDDFMLSNTWICPPPLHRIRSTLRAREVERGAISALFTTRRCYLQRSLDKIQEIWGDFDTYVRVGLAVSDEDATSLRRAYLETTC